MQIRKLLCCAFIAVAVSRKVSAAPLAGPFANPSNGHSYYLLNPDTRNRIRKRKQVGLGGHLATVRSQSENDWILNTFGPLVGQLRARTSGLGSTIQPRATAIGRRLPLRIFRWASGEPTTYTHWGQGEPNNSPAFGGEYYAILEVVPFDVLVPGDWNDQSNTSSNSSDYGVVEVVPEPSRYCTRYGNAPPLLAASQRSFSEQRHASPQLGPSPEHLAALPQRQRPSFSWMSRSGCISSLSRPANLRNRPDPVMVSGPHFVPRDEASSFPLSLSAQLARYRARLYGWLFMWRILGSRSSRR